MPIGNRVESETNGLAERGKQKALIDQILKCFQTLRVPVAQRESYTAFMKLIRQNIVQEKAGIDPLIAINEKQLRLRGLLHLFLTNNLADDMFLCSIIEQRNGASFVLRRGEKYFALRIGTEVYPIGKAVLESSSIWLKDFSKMMENRRKKGDTSPEPEPYLPVITVPLEWIPMDIIIMYMAPILQGETGEIPLVTRSKENPLDLIKSAIENLLQLKAKEVLDQVEVAKQQIYTTFGV